MAKYLHIIFILIVLSVQAVAQPLSFVKNQGQWQEDFDYRLSLGNAVVFLEGNGLTIDLADQNDLLRLEEMRHGETTVEDKLHMHRHAYRVNFIGASDELSPKAFQKRETYYNYFLGNNPEKWQAQVPLFGEVVYEALYSGIDLRYYFSKEGQMKYDLILKPGAASDQVRLSYEGADELMLSDGNLLVKTSVGEVVESAPVAYQIIDGEQREVRCRYVLSGNEISFEVGAYDSTETLIIDPQLIFSTYTGSTANNWGYTATYSEDGGLYAGGIVFGGIGSYPTTTGAYQASHQGGDTDIGISKFSADGSYMRYSTYIGGGGPEMPYSLFETADKQLVIMGSTGSGNYPTTANAYDSIYNGGTQQNFWGGFIRYPNGSDIFFTVLDSSGSGLSASTYFGGSANDGFNMQLEHNYGDIFRGEVIADTDGNIFGVFSTHSSSLPTGPGSYLTSRPGGQDGFAVSFSSDLSTLHWGTYVGGLSADNALSIKKGYNNDIYVAGGTTNGNMSFGPNAHHSQAIAGVDGYILRLNEVDGSLLSGTYNGTSARDMNFFLDVDHSGGIYVFGQTRGNYHVFGSGVYSNPGSSQYIHKLSADLTSSLQSTTIGSGTNSASNISPTAFMVDGCKNVFLSGWGGQINLPFGQGTTNGLPVTPDAHQDTTDGSDFYFLVLDNSWGHLKYATYFGGTNNEHVDGGTSRFSRTGAIYQAVCAGCQDTSLFPVTSNAWSMLNRSSGCNLAALKMDFDNKAVEAIATVDVNQDTACIPFTGNIINLSANADFYQWKFPGGQVIQGDTSSVSITEPGRHTFRLYATDTTCNQVDSTDIVLFGVDDSLTAHVETDIDSACVPYTVNLNNLSYNATDYRWRYPDGQVTTGDISSLSITDEGHQSYWLITTNKYCGLIDSTEFSLFGSGGRPQADFSVDYDSCASEFQVDLINNSQNADRFVWYFGDGDTLAGDFASHSFAAPGTYEIKLIAQNSVCEREDTSIHSITFREPPVFDDFSLEYEPCENAAEIVLTASGTGFQQYLWDFGDGTAEEGTFLTHEYTQPGDYEVFLELRDTLCGHSVEVDTSFTIYDDSGEPLTVPNVFTPNMDGVNDYFGPINPPSPLISEYSLRVYNRWGREVYSSGSVSEPWDGRVDGTDVSEGVYFYLLNYTDECDESYEYKGFVHLSR